MLCGQRGFFLSSTQYESVILEFVNTRNGAVTYKFSKIEEVNGFAIYTRISTDGAQTWQEWQRQDLEIAANPAVFAIQYAQGIICEAYVVVIGDGSREQSDPSNIITTIVPREPALSPPVIEAYPFYYNGRPYPAIVHEYMPTGVSMWALWHRLTQNPNWTQYGVVGGRYGIFTTEVFSVGVAYQFRTAWASNDGTTLLSDLSNTANLTLPSAEIQYLLPPIKIDAAYYQHTDNNYYNKLTVLRGDMRGSSLYIEYKRSLLAPLAWTPLGSGGAAGVAGQYTWQELGMADPSTETAGSLLFGFSSADIITGEVWEYRLRNRASGLTQSDWSATFSVTIPPQLPRLNTPTIRFNQSGSNVIISWNSVSYAVGYKLERRLTEELNFTLVSDSIPSSWTSYEDTATQYNNTYVYRLTALGNNTTYQDSLPAEDMISVEQTVVIPAPVISNLALAQNGLDVTMTISNLDGAHSRSTYIELSEDNSAWSRVGVANVESVAVTSVSVTIPTEKILHGGVLRFRAYQYGGGIYEDSAYSNIESLTIDHRQWLLRWTGTTWDYCTSVTGGWSSPNMTFSDGVVAGNVTAVNQGSGILRLQGSGYYMTGALTSGSTALSSIYKKIFMIGSLVKESTGLDYHAWFGSGHTYPFSGGTSIERRSSYYVFAGSESGRGAAGTRTDPSVNACAAGTYSNSTGAHVFFRFADGHADIRGIFATLQS